MQFRKFMSAIPILSLGISSLAFGHNAQQSHDPYGSQMNSNPQGTHQRGTYREITPNAAPRVAHGADVFITADFIWWKASQDGLDFASTGFVTGSAPANAPFSNNASKGKMASVGQDWAPGFKVGLGLNLEHDGWDLYAQYTWLHASDSSSISGSDVGFATLAISGDGPVARTTNGRATSSWDLHFNVIDLELGRNFYLSQFIAMRPHIGLKGTWQDQDRTSRLYGEGLRVEVEGQPNERLDVTGPLVSRESQDTWGIGIRGGFNLSWYMSKNWSIYGDMSWTALMTSYYKQKRVDTLIDSTLNDSQVTVNLDNDTTYHVNYVGEIELGLRWETWFSNDDYHFSIQAGWEEQVWLSWLRPIELIDEAHHDLSFHGLNLKFRFDF